MRSYTGKNICKKIIIAFLTFVFLFQFMMPVKSEADFFEQFPSGEEVATSMAQMLAAGGDLVMGALNNFMLGTKGFGTAMVSNEALHKGSWFDPKEEAKNENGVTLTDESGNARLNDVAPTESPAKVDEMTVTKEDSKIFVFVQEGTMDEHAVFAGSDTWEIPNLLYCPENIFGNNIALLDVNFLNPNEYSPVVKSNFDEKSKEELSRGVDSAEEKNGKDSSIAKELKSTIVGWYKAFRLIAIVALLSILVYLGIRILISSTAEDKAKYKEIIKDWLIALVLVFVMHFIMLFAIMIINQINTLFKNANDSIFVSYNGELFKSNYIGVIRFMAQSTDGWNAWAYTIIYITLVAYTVSFTFQYLKRVLYIAFYTMISPLVAITYPLDKLGDGKSQAFNKWLKEYIMTMSLQPIHLIIYTMIVSSTLTLSIKSPIYAIVAIGFLIPAEQFIKSLFGVESKADGGFAAGAATAALAMGALGKVKNPLSLSAGNSGKGGNSSKGEEKDDSSEDKAPKIRQSGSKALSSFNKDKDSEGIKGEANNENADSSVKTANNEPTDRTQNMLGSGNAQDTDSPKDDTEDSTDPLRLGNADQPELDDENQPIQDSKENEPNDASKEPSGSRTAQLFKDTYDNSKLAEFNRRKKLEQAMKKAVKEEEAEKRKKEAERKKAEKAKIAKEKQEAKRRIKNIKANKFKTDHPQMVKTAGAVKDGLQSAGKKVGEVGKKMAKPFEKPARFTRSLVGAVAGDAGDKIKGAIAKRAADAPKRAIKRAVNKKYAGKVFKAVAGPIGKDLKKLAKAAPKAISKGIRTGVGTVAKNGLRIGAGALGAGAGLAIGLASGKGLQGAIQGMGAGMATGMGLGDSAFNVGAKAANGVADFAEQGVANRYGEIKSIIELDREKKMEMLEATEGPEAADKYAREHLTRAEKKRYSQMLQDYTIETGETVKGKEKEEMFKKMYDYESHGVTDQSKIIKGLQIEKDDKYNLSHDNVVDVMSLASEYGKEYTLDDKKEKVLDKVISDKVSSPEDREKIKEIFYAAHGRTYQKETGTPTGNDTTTKTSSATRRATASEPKGQRTKRSQKQPVITQPQPTADTSASGHTEPANTTSVEPSATPKKSSGGKKTSSKKSGSKKGKGKKKK